MKFKICLLALLVLSPSISEAQARKTFINEIEGVYKEGIKVGFISTNKEGYEYENAENVLEITPYEKDSIYFKTHLIFTNGHTCNLSGIAKQVYDLFIYKGENNCRLSIGVTGDYITLMDLNETCRENTCGARGGYRNITFSRTKSRPITYMRTIVKSPEYKAAVERYNSP